jgi:hypothetical protein
MSKALSGLSFTSALAGLPLDCDSQTAKTLNQTEKRATHGGGGILTSESAAGNATDNKLDLSGTSDKFSVSLLYSAHTRPNYSGTSVALSARREGRGEWTRSTSQSKHSSSKNEH